MDLQPDAIASPGYGLSEADMASLRSATSDLGDIDNRSLERYRTGFKQAYHVAHLVATGKKDPQSR